MKSTVYTTRNLLLLIALCTSLCTRAASAFVGERTDFRDETIYFVMTTRFYDGDPSNNTHCWDGNNPGDPAWRGDFKGLIEKLDYIKALGFTAVWITPVVENASGYDYHGYHAHDMSKVDHRYESDDVSFQTLIDEAHARGMKIILDIVLNHTGNFGEANLCPLFTRDWDGVQADINDCMIPITEKDGGRLPDNYSDLPGAAQYSARLSQMKNTTGVNYDNHNYWHHLGTGWNWDEPGRWFGQIAGDCVDLNTENPAVYNYLIDCYSQFIAMGVDGFRIDTGGHIPRLTFNKAFIPAFHEVAEQYKDKRLNGCPFYMFAEVCARYSSIWYREQPCLSPLYYTWKEETDYEWDDNAESWDNIVAMEGDACRTHTNHVSVWASADGDGEINAQRTSENAFLEGNSYHTPDYSQNSGLNIIDFTMHHNFRSIGEAWNVAQPQNDKYYNDATFNVVYVDSHDYAPNGAPESQRFAQGTDAWAENLALMFTYRGIPCLYYGSEIEFRKGSLIEPGGPNGIPLKESGRAYFGGYIKGDVTVNDFADWENAQGNINATLNYPLALHIQRLNRIRMAIPALRKGQYSLDGCSGSYAFKRRYTDSTTDSYVLVTISGNATFTGIENGTYVDAITGKTEVVTDNTLTATCSGKGNMRIYVLNTDKTPAPGKVGEDGKWLYDTAPVTTEQPAYDGTEEEDTSNEGPLPGSGDVGGGDEPVIEPCISGNEQCIFFEKPSHWGTRVYAYIYYNGTDGVVMVTGAWPGTACTSLGNNIYKYSLPEDADIINSTAQWYVLFSDGSGNQTQGDPGFECEDAAYYTVDGYSKTITTACTSITIAAETSKQLVIFTRGNNLYVDTPHAQTLYIYGIDGRLVRVVEATKGLNMIKGLARGMYLVNGNKAIVQ